MNGYVTFIYHGGLDSGRMWWYAGTEFSVRLMATMLERGSTTINGKPSVSGIDVYFDGAPLERTKEGRWL